MPSYPVYEAKARLSELLRQVRTLCSDQRHR